MLVTKPYYSLLVFPSVNFNVTNIMSTHLILTYMSADKKIQHENNFHRNPHLSINEHISSPQTLILAVRN